jgi:acetylglutamate kinase
MVLCGKVNKDITALIQKAGGRAMGLCGLDGAMLKARRISEEDLGLVGEIESVDAYLIETVLDSGAIPVISSVAYNIGEGANPIPGGALNINADIAAAKIAAALKAEKIILMTDLKGILRNVNDPDSLIGAVRRSELPGLKKDGIVNKGMIPKVDCCSMALDGGVKKAHILDGRVPHALLIELFSDKGIGTMLQGDDDE